MAGTTSPSADKIKLARHFLPFTFHMWPTLLKRSYIHTVMSETMSAISALWYYLIIIGRIKVA